MKEFMDAISYIYPIIASMLSVVAAFVAVYWVLNNTQRYSSAAKVGYSSIAALIVAAAEIGLALIGFYHRREREEALRKYYRTHPGEDLTTDEQSSSSKKTSRNKNGEKTKQVSKVQPKEDAASKGTEKPTTEQIIPDTKTPDEDSTVRLRLPKTEIKKEKNRKKQNSNSKNNSD